MKRLTLCFLWLIAAPVYCQLDSLQKFNPSYYSAYLDIIKNIEVGRKVPDGTGNISKSELQKILKDQRTNAINLKYEFGKKTLDVMTKGIIIVDFIQNITDLQDEIRSKTSIWEYKPIKNTWDRINDFATVAGGTIASIGVLASNSQNGKQNSLLLGLNLIAIPKLVGLVSKKNKKAEEKYNSLMAKADTTFKYVAMSAGAFNDLKILNYKLKQYIASNEQLKIELNKFIKDYYSLNASSIDGATELDTTTFKKKFYLEKLVTYINKYDLVLSQIPEYLYEMKAFSNRYHKEYEYFGKTFKSLSDKVDALEKKYNSELLPILSVDKTTILYAF